MGLFQTRPEDKFKAFTVPELPSDASEKDSLQYVQKLDELHGSASSQYKYWKWVQDSGERRLAEATEALQKAQTEVERVNQEIISAPGRIDDLLDAMEKINARRKSAKLTPTREKLARLKAQIRELEAQMGDSHES